jgi:phage terminase large subunit-like protein
MAVDGAKSETKVPRKANVARKPRKKKLHSVETYLAAVRDGSIVTSKLVRQAVERHFIDLELGETRGLYFDREAAEHVIDFFPQFLVHTEGEWDGKPFQLEPSQQAKLWILYGWKRKATGYRRFNYAYVEEGRGQGKSALASGLCLYELIAFGEAGAQVYSAATDKKTARLVWDTAALMVNRSPLLKSRITIYRDNMHIAGTASKFEPCASDSDNLLGLRPSFFVLDELHVHPNSGVLDVFFSAMGKRRNPLGLMITNSGYDRLSVCYKQREYSIKVLDAATSGDSSFADNSWFAWISGIDDEDDWEDERNWIKANPMLGTVVSLDNMRQQALKAKNDPSSLNAFLRFRLSRWTESDVAWMPMHLWDACRGVVDAERLRGRQCIGALDLSTTTDISAFGMIFPPVAADPYWSVLVDFFLPREAIQDRVKRDRVPYDVWERQELFHLTRGRVVDYDVIRAVVNRRAEQFDLKEVCFDRWNSSDIVKDLETDGFTMIKWGQGFNDMNAPTKRLMELVLNGELAHGANPVLRWMAGNVMAYMDPAGNIKPDKARSKEKIDGIVAILMALGRAMLVGQNEYASSEPIWL